MNKEIWENFAYLRDVLGVRFLRTSRAVSSRSVSQALIELEAGVKVCEKCRLSRGRKMAVFGSGAKDATVMFIGESPGEQEDVEGLPFVGAGGKLLSKMILAMGLQREAVYLANIIKCRPPLNRAPEETEISQCSSYIDAQIKMISPKIIITLGELTAQTLLRTQDKMGALRGKLIVKNGRRYLATYHPNDLLRNPELKKAVWEDLQVVMQDLGLRRLKN